VWSLASSDATQGVAKTADVLTKYLDTVDSAPQALGPVAAIGNLDQVRKDLDRLEPAFGPALTADRRRRVIASFTLEVAAAGMAYEPSAAGRLLEWECQKIRVHAPPDEFDARWQLASLSLFEAMRDPGVLEAHLAHAQAQTPSEPRFVLGYAIAAEQRADLARSAQSSDSRADAEAQRRDDEALRRFKNALADARINRPAERAEAWLRTGHLELEARRTELALAALAESERSATEPSVIYLARLFRGIALESQDKLDDARASYESALQTLPGSHAATMALAALAFRQGDRRGAKGLTDALMGERRPTLDPWWSYGMGDFRLWPERIQAMRDFLK
jgi:tetratricopeptide (TPR) repeat protein